MKKEDIIKVFREVVRQEIRKEFKSIIQEEVRKILPQLLTETFQGLMQNNTNSRQIVQETRAPAKKEPRSKTPLKNLLSTEIAGQPSQPTEKKEVKYVKDPVLNEIFNTARPFNRMERMSMGGGGGLMSPMVAMAASEAGVGNMGMGGGETGESFSDDELKFLQNIPEMPSPGGSDTSISQLVPERSGPSPTQLLTEGQEGGPAPLEHLEGNIESALDLKHHIPQDTVLGKALNRDYRSLMKAINKK